MLIESSRSHTCRYRQCGRCCAGPTRRHSSRTEAAGGILGKTGAGEADLLVKSSGWGDGDRRGSGATTGHDTTSGRKAKGETARNCGGDGNGESGGSRGREVVVSAIDSGDAIRSDGKGAGGVSGHARGDGSGAESGGAVHEGNGAGGSCVAARGSGNGRRQGDTGACRDRGCRGCECCCRGGRAASSDGQHVSRCGRGTGEVGVAAVRPRKIVGARREVAGSEVRLTRSIERTGGDGRRRAAVDAVGKRVGPRR